MSQDQQAKEGFRFYTRLHLTELTGLRAATLGQLLDLVKQVPESCIYHHTHRFLQQHQTFSPEPPNDFSYWVAEALGEDRLAEELASVDVIQFVCLEDLRKEFVRIIEAYLGENPLSKLKFCRSEEEFNFIKSVSFILPTSYTASNLADFVEILKKVGIDSLYFHIFEARLRLGKTTNDFSWWIDSSLGNKVLAEKISRLDPYTYTMEELRLTLIKIAQMFA